MKITILTTGNLQDMKGIMNYVQEKNLQLLYHCDGTYTTECYFLEFYYSFVASKVLSVFRRKKVKAETILNSSIEKRYDVVYKILHIRLDTLSIIYGLITKQLYSKFIIRQVIKQYPEILDADIISSHQLPSHFIAKLLKEKYGIPYIATWHGSDINISPFCSNRIFSATKGVLEGANMNYFVSKRLLKESDKITTSAIKDYIYTGPSDIFVIPNKEDRILAKAKQVFTTDYYSIFYR